MIPRTICAHFSNAECGVAPPGEVAGDGQQSAELEFYGCGGENAQIIWIARWTGSPRCLGCGGSGWALSKRKGPRGVRDKETRGGSNIEKTDSPGSAGEK